MAGPRRPGPSAGSGCSAFDAKPTWQTVTTNCARRAEADVSAVADPNTGVAVYQTFGASGWVVYGGTSVSAPIIAERLRARRQPRLAGDYPASYPYAHPGNLFDVTSGSNGTCGAPICTAGVGWDGPTGLGTPNGTAAFTAGGGGPRAADGEQPGQQDHRGHRISSQPHAVGQSVARRRTHGRRPAFRPALSINSSSGVISRYADNRRHLQRGRDRARRGALARQRHVHLDDHIRAADALRRSCSVTRASRSVRPRRGPTSRGRRPERRRASRRTAARGTRGWTDTAPPTPTRSARR